MDSGAETLNRRLKKRQHGSRAALPTIITPRKIKTPLAFIIFLVTVAALIYCWMRARGVCKLLRRDTRILVGRSQFSSVGHGVRKLN